MTRNIIIARHLSISAVKPLYNWVELLLSPVNDPELAKHDEDEDDEAGDNTADPTGLKCIDYHLFHH